ncbi:TIGR03761 family integrating conjugative element protein [Histophilus somni]|uniref:TIGR03761 family integrating conjugative element protein n=1 Tax=Histophilus somni TaxID=731 RepID=A0A649Z2D6_HISSO|nr:TIGR03761 family integrating conjugative element protein [Histophilus somni]QEH26694.1 TIGR03761 family integrating conjugative element protein [Histophilus somni]QEH50888.1 TIGR03761 family integrating conjugative element protein [Histophilus somni]QGM49026.1 TIGR03761 family integrating conjugative element protein [Histophilus somni]
MTTQLDPQLGPLRSEITFTLHTQYAHKLWMGRPMIRNGEGKVTQSSIISVPNCFAMLTQIQRAASEDDPYADDYLIQFEEKVISYRKEIQKLTNDIVTLYAKMLPEGISIERCANISPISYPIYVNSQLGYQLLYLLGDFDSLCRSVMTAAHIAIINRAEAQDWIEAGARLIRKCFGIVERYKHSGITRRDYQENNARYQAAVKRMGYTLSDAVLTGEHRAEFAPFIKQNTTVEEEQSVETHITAQTNESQK